MDKQLQDKLRLLKVDLLSILLTLARTEYIAVELHEISQSTSTSEPELRGAISALRRIKVEDEFLIMPAGRDHMGRLRWQLNEKVVGKEELAKFLEIII